MIKIVVLNIKPLPVNQAWQGKRFKTGYYRVFEDAVGWMLKKYKIELEKEIEELWNKPLNIKVRIDTPYAYNTDVDNLLKPLLDILVKGEIISDDVYIQQLAIRKKQSKDYKIEIRIKEGRPFK